MLSIFIEASCNRYERDECVDCHVFEPLTPHFKSADWRLSPAQAQTMADKISQVEVLSALAQQEINLTGGEASQNPDVVEIFKIFRTVTPNVCIHTNLEIPAQDSKRWKRLAGIMELGGRVDVTLYPTAWEKYQEPLLAETLKLQNQLLINVVFFSLPDLRDQVRLLRDFFSARGGSYNKATQLLDDYLQKIDYLTENHSQCGEELYAHHMGETGAFAYMENFTLGINLLPAFKIDPQGRRSMESIPFPKDPYLLNCPAAKGSVDIMTVRLDGEMTPCCDVGNLKCQPGFGNLLSDSAEAIMEKFERSRLLMKAGVLKNQQNLKSERKGDWVEEGVPPYCV